MKYALLGLRRLLRSIEYLCVTCKASTIQPIMFYLPVKRLGYKQSPFNHSGVDYFGPLYVPVRRSTEKRWDFLSLLQNQGRHHGIVPSLYTGSLSSRGTPITIRSENKRTSLVRKTKYLPASRAEMAWLRPFLHTKVLLGNLTRQAHPIMAALESASSEWLRGCFMIY